MAKRKTGKKKGVSKMRKFVYAFILLMITAVLITGYTFFQKVFSPNVVISKAEDTYIYIPTGASFTEVMRILNENNLLFNSASFEWTAEIMKYKQQVKPGKYLIKPSWSNKDLVALLRSGKQTPVKVTFNNIRTIEQFAGRISSLIEADSVSLVNIFKHEEFVDKYGFNADNSLAMLIPNTYEFYWNTSADKFFERMAEEYKRFWNANRKSKLLRTGLSQTEVSIIASIVEQETRQDKEKPTIAGVYINRFRKNWNLEADPTLVYALGDFSIRRVLNQHKEIDSPYNTYKYKGLPPGPICIPGIASIDAVLNYVVHDYMFFCAREDFSGYHVFAETYYRHLVNARKFQKALNRRGIMN